MHWADAVEKKIGCQLGFIHTMSSRVARLKLLQQQQQQQQQDEQQRQQDEQLVAGTAESALGEVAPPGEAPLASAGQEPAAAVQPDRESSLPARKPFAFRLKKPQQTVESVALPSQEALPDQGHVEVDTSCSTSETLSPLAFANMTHDCPSQC